MINKDKHTQFINKIHRSGICIYSIENLSNGKRYIGQSTNIIYRRESHIYNLINDKHHNKQLQEDFNRGDIFEIKALEYFPKWITKNFLNGKEYIYIKKYNSDKYGYNINFPNITHSLCKATPEKYKISFSQIQCKIANINNQGGLTYSKIDGLCKLLKCDPDDLIESNNK